MIKFKADVYIECLGVYSLSVCYDAFCSLSQENCERQEADEEG